MHIEPFSLSRDPFKMGMDLPVGEIVIDDELILRKYCEGALVAVNLGAYKGRSSVLLSYFADQVVAIDSFWGMPEDVKPSCIKAIAKRPNIELVETLSWEGAKSFVDGSVDFVFQDAGHSNEDVTMDFNAWWPKLKVGGTMVFHDYKHMDGSVSESMNVRGAVDKIIASNPETVEAVDEAGWCKVIRKVK